MKFIIKTYLEVVSLSLLTLVIPLYAMFYLTFEVGRYYATGIVLGFYIIHVLALQNKKFYEFITS